MPQRLKNVCGGGQKLPNNPYDGHTLSDQLDQVSILCAQSAEEAYVDRGYKGHRHAGTTEIYIAGQKRSIGVRQKTRLRRRNTVEPIIGHLKSDGKMGRCYLKGTLGDAMNVILCGAGHNIRKLLRWLFYRHLLYLFDWFRQAFIAEQAVFNRYCLCMA